MLSLERYRMLDLSRILPGPFTSHILADLGMEIIKVEEPEPRYGMPRDSLSPVNPTPDLEERYAAYNVLARNKKSIALNLVDPTKRPQCQDIFYHLAQRADVVLDGYRPGTLKWMGVDYETVREYNPRIIYCCLTGFGQTGPYANRPAHGGQFDALAGTLRSDSDGQPIANGLALGDLSGALHAAICIVGALLHREHTGEGQFIDVSLSAAAMALMAAAAGRHARGDAPIQQPDRGRYPLGFLRCKDGKWITTGNAETIFWQNFCKALGKPEWIPLHRTQGPEAEKMGKEIQEIFLTKTRAEWLEILVKAETCAAPVNDIGDALQDPHMREIGMVWEMQHPKMGSVTQPGFPARFLGKPVPPGAFAPVLGQHTRQILTEIGYGQAQITELEKRGVVESWESFLQKSQR